MVVLLNPFTVAPEHEEAFLALWDRTNAIFRTKPGYIDAKLHRARELQPAGMRAPHTHLNVAHWRSEADYVAALADPEIRRLAGDYRHVSTFAPALYDVVRDV